MNGDKRGRVALMTIFQVPNYGSLLQAYATQEILKTLGYDCDIINYHYPNEWHFRVFAARPNRLREMIMTILRVLKLRKMDRLRAAVCRFRHRKLKLTRRFDSLDALEAYDWSGYDAVIAGSDQIWNPLFLHGDKAFMLSFVPDGVLKFSFASSFACKALPDEFVAKYRKYLSRLDSISVRDNNGAEIVKSQLGLPVDPFVALDPTLLLSADDWIEKTPAKVKHDKKYLLVYLLSYAFDPFPYIFDVVAEMERRYGCKAIYITDCYDRLEPSMQTRINTSPEEFVALVRDAECVITTSFHGTAFAVNFGRPVVSVIPDGGDDRQMSLLANLGIRHCAARIGSGVEDIVPEYDSAEVLRRLEEMCRINMDWLASAIGHISR